MNLRPKLIELFDRTIKSVSSQSGRDYYINGDNNLYPNEIDLCINNSPTGKPAANTFKNYIIGKGVTNDFVVNRKNKMYLSGLINDIGEDLSKQYGCFIWVGYGFNDNGELVPKNYKVLDYLKCRFEINDDDDRPAKIIYKDWDKSNKGFLNLKKDKEKRFYPYNPNPRIVREQMENDNPDADLEDQIKNYSGQVFYLNLTPQYRYALSKFDNVFNDMDSEFRFSLYVNTQMRTGWTGKTIIVTQGLDPEEEDDFSKDMSKLLGAENSGNAYHLNVDNAEKLEDVLDIKQVKAQFDDKLSLNTDKRLRRNITNAANNLPEQLINAGDGAMFGTGGDTIREYKEFYSDQTRNERNALNNALKKLKINSEIIPIV